METPFTMLKASFRMVGKRCHKVSFSSCNCSSVCALAMMPCTQGERYFSNFNLPKVKPPMMPKTIPVATYKAVTLKPKAPAKMAMATSFTNGAVTVSYTHLRAHETDSYLVCRLLLEKK